MDQVINLHIPHIGEQILQSIDTNGLVECLSVSKSWKVLAENVLFNRYRGQLFEACKNGPLQVVRILVERSETEELNAKREDLTPFMTACNFFVTDKNKTYYYFFRK